MVMKKLFNISIFINPTKYLSFIKTVQFNKHLEKPSLYYQIANIN